MSKDNVDTPTYNAISICSGYGGIDLGIREIVPATTVCYVEIEISAAAILAERMEEGYLDQAPIWSDVKTFDTKPWRGKWISSLEGSLANPSQSQGRNAEKMIQETSGPIQPDLLGGLGFQSSFLKMCRESSDTTSTPYDPNLERWVMKLRKDYFQRQRQAHPTSANDSLSWGIANWTTPLADDTNTRKNKFAQGGTPLSMQASNWPTPTTQETPHEDMELTETGRRKTKDGQNSHSLNLQDVSANWNKETTWPIPMQRDYKGFDGPGKKNALKPPELYHSIHQGQETEKDGHSCSPSCRRLNPLFAEHLMGLPLGWTCVSEPLAMESFQQWQLALSENLQTS